MKIPNFSFLTDPSLQCSCREGYEHKYGKKELGEESL